MAAQRPNKLQYSLRGFAIALTAFCVWFGFQCHFARQQAAARKIVLKQDAQAVFDYQIAGNFPPWLPADVRRIFGEDLFATIVRLNFPDGALKDEGACLSALDGLPGVTVINLEGSAIDGANLAPVGRADLECLRLIDARVTDDGLQHLVSLKRLSLLDLSGNPITDEGLKHLAELDGLEYLTLKGTAVTDAGIQQLARLARLKYLNVQQTGVTAAGAAALQRHLPHVQVVCPDAPYARP